MDILIATVLLWNLACIEVRREVAATPETIPEEIEGARWQSEPGTYCLVPNNSGFVEHDRFAELVDEAFRQWGVAVDSSTECEQSAPGNGRNEITWGTADVGETARDAAGVYQAGYTRLLYRSCPGGCEDGAQSRIIEADILIEPSPPASFQNEECLLSALLHETGHFLGVPHLASPAVMAPTASECAQELTEADRSALADLYG